MIWLYFILFVCSALIILAAKSETDYLLWFIRFYMVFAQICMYPYRFIRNLGTKKICPPPENLLLFHSAKKLAHLIRTRQVKSEEIIKIYIARIKEVNPIINAVVDSRFEEAIADAIKVDTFLTITDKSEEELAKDMPLLGVPFTVKESIGVAGLSNAAGVWHKHIPRATSNAEIVQIVKSAGAIPLCVTNTPELCVNYETFNNVTGLTTNPYDTRRTVGGSSGGEAALLGSGSSVIGLGSDLGGSLRMPALFTGVYGHKPSTGIIPTLGSVPECEDENFNNLFGLGPMTRYAEDMALLFPILTKPEVRKQLRLDEEVVIKDIKFFYMEVDTNREVILAMRKFAAYLKNQYGINAQKVDIKDMNNSVDLFKIATPHMFPIERLHCLFYNEETNKYSIWKHVLKKLACMSNVTAHVIAFGFLLISTRFFVARKPAAIRGREKLRSQLKDLLGDNGVLLFPTFSDVAHYHREIQFKLLEGSYLSIFNILEMPSTQCPVGYNQDGMPLGLQVVANPNNDRLTIAVAAELEKAFGGWKPPAYNNE